ncbi:MAG: sulfotransferase [Trueperaceae bacterium]
MSTGIFVVGRNRSGTKWLANSISNHEDVSSIRGARSERTGVLEANLFLHFPAIFGDLSINDHYYAFLASFKHSNYFLLTGLPESVLYEKRHLDYLSLFRFLMDRTAEARGQPMWLQKASSLMLPELYRAFPDARFVVIQRTNVRDNVRSSIALGSRGKALDRHKPNRVARELFSYYVHRATERAYLHHPNVLRVTYEDMRERREATLREVCAFVGLTFDACVLEDRYRPNSSFVARKRDEVLTPVDTRVFQLLHPFARVVPGSMLRFFQGMEQRLLGPRRQGRRLISGAFGMYRNEVERHSKGVIDAGAAVSLPTRVPDTATRTASGSSRPA